MGAVCSLGGKELEAWGSYRGSPSSLWKEAKPPGMPTAKLLPRRDTLAELTEQVLRWAGPRGSI